MPIAEELLHFIWQLRLYNPKDLKTTNGDPLIVVNPGQYNRNAGPDFEFAKLQIGDTLWSGHIEIHVYAKDWYNHRHNADLAYNSTILHVVWENNHEAIRADGTHILTVELKNHIAPSILSKYRELMHNLHWIPCEQQIQQVNSLTRNTWLDRMAIERMESKYEYLSNLLDKSKNHWEKVLLVTLGRAFGMKVNALAFEHLMQKTEFSLLLKYQSQPVQLKALLFGISGLLPSDSDDSYVQDLYKEFQYLQKIHRLNIISVTEWKFHRMRPYNFPTFRLAQLIALYSHEVYWFDTILKTDDLRTIRKLLKSIQVDPYWEKHFRFSAATSVHPTLLSDTFINHIIINCFVPALFAYGKFVDNDSYKSKAIEWLEETPSEKNAITKKFETLSIQNTNAAISQGLLHLKKTYCERKQCLTCAIGLAILKNGKL